MPFLHGDRHVRLPASLAPLRRLADALVEDDDLAPLQVHAAALDLLCAAARAAPLEAAARRGAVLDRVVECLESDLTAPPAIDTLARVAGLHPHHLMRAFRQQRGETIGGYVRRRRLEIADVELRRPELALAEIALRAGFCDQAHFTRAFRRIVSETPNRWRQSRRTALMEGTAREVPGETVAWSRSMELPSERSALEARLMGIIRESAVRGSRDDVPDQARL